MKHAAFAIVVLLLAVPSEAAIITKCGQVCEEVLVLVPPPPAPPDPGWPLDWTAAQIAAAKAEDDAHEPIPEWALTLVCTTPPGKLPPMVPHGKPGHPGMPPDGSGGPHEPPEGPHMPPGDGGSGGGGHPVPEPSVLAMLLSACLAVGVRRIRR